MSSFITDILNALAVVFKPSAPPAAEADAGKKLMLVKEKLGGCPGYGNPGCT